nr:LOW QUALITY PROTEIN: kanadaptin [Ciona intestinalis]|eukprot:XP_026694178.1 LOW QUALITY PROTEIN: kanadaptin [Ciona intestinalis]
MSENDVKPEAGPDTANGGFKSPEVFKVPTLLKASPSIAKQKSTKPTEPEKKDDSAKKDGKCEKEDERKIISFRPKSNALPSQVYKPHQPSAGEYLVRKLKSNQKEKEAEKVHENKSEKPVEKTEKKSEKNSQTKPKKTTPKLDYTVPSWSCIPDADSYSLEVLKTGAIINNSELKGKEYFVFGRLPECDFMLEHPSISRHHAVLQFGKPSENDNVELQKDGSAGFYLIDLGSTHGTFLNKTKIPSHKYYRVKVGHMMKFGGSSRMHFLQGPSEDEEKEAEETATELREKNRLKKLESEKKDLAKMMLGDDDSDEEDLEDEEHQTRRADQDTGITWGMLEDAVEEEEEEEEETSKEPGPPMTLFRCSRKRDPFYVKDPNKALKNFYEKEGIELNFDCTERRPGQWTARLEMPVDTPSGKPIFAEASVTGKRRDAMNNCALEACRILDKHGMFRQSEGHQRKVKQWEKDDFYDSDEDGYLDRTGDLDTKRQQRKHRVGQGKKKKSGGDKMETYESLNEQIAQLEKEILQIEKQLEKDKQATKSKEMGEDPLEAFMQQVKAGKTLDSLTRSKLKQKLFNMKKESGRLCKLAAIARPASLPALNNSVSKSMAFIGRMKGKRKGKLVVNTELPPPTRRRIEENNEVEVEEEEEEQEENERNKEEPLQEKMEETKAVSPLRQDNTPVQIASTTKTKDEKKIDTPEVTHTIPTETPSPEPLITKEKLPKRPKVLPESEKKSKIRTFGPTLPESLKRELMGENEPSQNADEDENEGKPRRRKRNRKKNPAPQTTVCSDDPNYAHWLPPQGQTGDGTTSLNAKFGY